jgi:excisionase family DNA binding protein
MDKLLSIQDVSKITGLSVGTLYHLISQGRIPVLRISSRCVRFRTTDIEQWLAEKLVASQDTLRSLAGKKYGKRAGGDAK